MLAPIRLVWTVRASIQPRRPFGTPGAITPSHRPRLAATETTSGEPKSPRVLLSSGTGATIAREIDDGRGEFLVALDIQGDIIRMARPIERDWLEPTRREKVQEGDRIVEHWTYWDRMSLAEQLGASGVPLRPGPTEADEPPDTPRRRAEVPLDSP